MLTRRMFVKGVAAALIGANTLLIRPERSACESFQWARMGGKSNLQRAIFKQHPDWITIGVDRSTPAGDQTAIVARRGDKILWIKTIP